MLIIDECVLEEIFESFREIENISRMLILLPNIHYDTLPVLVFANICSQGNLFQAAQIPSVDRPDAGNTQAVAEYAADIFKYLRERETVRKAIREAVDEV